MASSNGVGASGTVPAGTTAATGPPGAVSTVNFTTPGGDGYSVEGSGGSIYTVFRHSSGATVVYCAGSVLTSGLYVYQTYIPSTGPSAGSQFISCYDTATSAACAGFPKNEGAPVSNNPDYVAPVLSSSGSLLGVCDVAKANCYSPTGATIAVPYPGCSGLADLSPGPGFGSGAIVGSRFYTSYPSNVADPNTTTVLCFDFSAWSGSGAVPQCSGFTGQVDEQNYTVRALANLPSCMAADGNLGLIIIFTPRPGGRAPRTLHRR